MRLPRLRCLLQRLHAVSTAQCPLVIFVTESFDGVIPTNLCNPWKKNSLLEQDGHRALDP
jgi:hypothetical protein